MTFACKRYAMSPLVCYCMGILMMGLNAILISQKTCKTNTCDSVHNNTDAIIMTHPLASTNNKAIIMTHPLASAMKYNNILASVDNTLRVGNPETRDNWILNKARVLFFQGGQVLDVSAGAKPYKAAMQDTIGWQYFSTEFEDNKVLTDTFRRESGDTGTKNMKSLHDFVGPDISDTGAPSNQFDLVLLTEVLEHLPEPALAFVELKRVTKPGGHILVTAPFTSGSHQQPYHFASGYSREWYQYFARKHDLEIVEMVSQGDFFKLLAQEVSRGFGCGNEIPGIMDHRALEHVRDFMPQYFLQKSKHNTRDTASCFDQFTIGWMVHLRKV